MNRIASFAVASFVACSPQMPVVDGGSLGGGSTAGGSSGGSAAGGSSAGGSSGGGATAGGATAGGSVGGGSVGGGSVGGGSVGGGSVGGGLAIDAGTFVAETGLPTLATLRTVWGTSATNVFVGGAADVTFSGATLRLQGSTWVRTDEVRTTAIWGSSATDVWAGGDRALRRWNGTQWQPFISQGTVTAIHGSAADDVWMVDRSLVSRFDGTNIVFPPALPNNRDWRTVWAFAPNDAWVGGQYGTVAHFDGTAWTILDCGFSSTPFQADVLGFWAAGQNDLWAVGGRFSSTRNSAEVSHWNGTSWTASAITTAGALQAVWGAGPNDVWAVGQGVVHFDGTAWSSVTVPTQQTLYAVWGSAANDVWAVGAGGTILHFDGGAWRQVAPTVPAAKVIGIWAASPTELFAVGDDVLASAGNGTWTNEARPDGGTLVSVHGRSASDVWAVGTEETVLHRTASGWSSVSLPTLVDAGQGDGGTGLSDVFAVTSNEVWAVGELGTVVRWNGSAFTQMPAPTAKNVNAVWAAGPNDVWVAGPDLLARWNGSDWVSAPGFIGGVVADVWGTSATDIWAVGGSGLTIDGHTFVVRNAPAFIWHYDGTSWTRSSSGVTALRKIWASGTGVWAAGFGGDLRSFDGSTWTTRTPAAAPISSLTSAGGTLWMVSGGQIVRGN